MFSFSYTGNKAVPREFRSIAAKLFSVKKNTFKSIIEYAMAFAKALGINQDYTVCIETYKDGKDLEHFLNSFQNNVELLIQKTWVEEADVNRKEELQAKLPVFIDKIKNEHYKLALEEFGAILEELAYLFFGEQSKKIDFNEYAFRIDPQVGLFWWYGGLLCSAPGQDWSITAENSALLAVLLLGICYLTNF